MVQKKKKLNPVAQMIAERESLKRLYPSGKFLKATNDVLLWESEIIPTSVSNKYVVRIEYKYGTFPKIYIINPKPLKKYGGEKSLPHVYSTENQRICLYKPGIGEWNREKLIARTIVPWASEWLQFYELWLATGIWFGEGLHPKSPDKKRDVSD